MSTVQGSWRGYGIVKDGLVLYLDASSPNSYNSNFGPTTWKDISGNGKNGTLLNGPIFNSGSGGGLLFDGTNDYVLNVAVEVYNNFSYDIWCLPQATHGIDPESTSSTLGTSGQRYLVFPDYIDPPNAGTGISVGTNGVSVYEHSTGYMPPLLVHETTITSPIHIVVNYTNKRPSLYLNGVFIKNGLTSPKPDVKITTNSLCGVLYGNFSGIVYNAKYYNRPLTDQEVLQNYNVTKSKFGL